MLAFKKVILYFTLLIKKVVFIVTELEITRYYPTLCVTDHLQAARIS